MPEAISGRLLVLVINTHCERKLFTSKNSNDPEKIARRFCTPDNCLVVVLRNNRFLFHVERGSRPRQSLVQRANIHLSSSV